MFNKWFKYVIVSHLEMFETIFSLPIPISVPGLWVLAYIEGTSAFHAKKEEVRIFSFFLLTALYTTHPVWM